MAEKSVSILATSSYLNTIKCFLQDRGQVWEHDLRPGAAAGEGLQRRREGHRFRGRDNSGHEARARQLQRRAVAAGGQVSHEAAGVRR